MDGLKPLGQTPGVTQPLSLASVLFLSLSKRWLCLLRQKTRWNSLPTWVTATRPRVDVTDQCSVRNGQTVTEPPSLSYRYEDLFVGMRFRSPGRTITDADVVGFAGLTGDYSELHTSDVYANSSQFGRRIAHGMLGLAYAHGLMWPRTGELRETAVAFLGIVDWRFVGPIFIGDTIFVNYALAELRDSKSRPTQAIASFDVEVVKQDNTVVQQGRKVLLLSKVPLDAVAASRAAVNSTSS